MYRWCTAGVPLVYRWCRHWHLQPADAKDVVQDVFGAVAKHIAALQRPAECGGFRAWLFTITRDKVRDFCRRRSQEPLGEGGTAAYERLCNLTGKTPSEAAWASDPTAEALLVRRAIGLIQAEFEDRTWEMFCRVALLGQRPAEVAAGFGVNVTAVYQAQSRVLYRLRQLPDEPPPR